MPDEMLDQEATEAVTDSTEQPIEDSTEQPEGVGESVETEATEDTPQAPETAGWEDGAFDPKALPTELQPVYKEMTAAYTRKTQALAQQRKEHEQFREHYGWAENLEKLAQSSPAEAAKQLRHIADQFEPEHKDPYADLEASTDDPAVKQLIQQNRELGKKLAEIEQGFQGLQQKDQTAQQSAELDGIRRQHFEGLESGDPRWTETAETIMKTAKDKGIDINDAFRIAYFDKQLERGKKAAYESMKDKEAATLPGDTPDKTSAVKVGSVRDAYEAAERELGVRLS